MVKEVGSIRVLLEAQFGQMMSALQTIDRRTSTFASKQQKDAATVARAWQGANAQIAGRIKGMFAGLAAGASLRGAQSLIDQSTRIQNALKVAGLEGENLNKVYGRLFQSAQRNAAPLETLVTLYGRAALVQKELGVSQEEMLNFTDKIAMALRVAGTDAQSASGALLQLSQALGSGVVRAEEFNSILEGALPIAQAAAAGLKEAGGSVARLRQLVVDGKVSSEAFFRAFEAGSVMLEQKVAGAEMTVSQHLVRLRNVLIDAAKDFNTGSGAAEEFGKMLGAVTEYIEETDFSHYGKEIAKYIRWTDQARKSVMAWLQAHGEATGQALGTDAIGEWIAQTSVGRKLGEWGIMRSTREMRQRFEGAPADGSGSLTSDMVEEWGRNRYPQQGGTTTTTERTGRLPKSTAVKPVSIADYDLPTSGKGKKGAKERADEYERLTDRIRKAMAAMDAETEALAQTNPLIDDHGYAVEKARMQQELLTAAQEAGKTVTPELGAEIEQLSEDYAQAVVAASKLAEEHEKLVDNMEFRKGIMKDVLSGLRQGLADGKLTFEELGDIALRVLDKIISKIEDELIEALFKIDFGGGGGGGGGFLGGLFKLFGFEKGGYTGDGAKDAPAGVVHRGEYVFDAESTDKIGVGTLAALRKAAKTGTVGAMLSGMAGRVGNVGNLPGFRAGGFVGAMPTGGTGRGVSGRIPV